MIDSQTALQCHWHAGLHWLFMLWLRMTGENSEVMYIYLNTSLSLPLEDSGNHPLHTKLEKLYIIMLNFLKWSSTEAAKLYGGWRNIYINLHICKWQCISMELCLDNDCASTTSCKSIALLIKHIPSSIYIMICNVCELLSEDCSSKKGHTCCSLFISAFETVVSHHWVTESRICQVSWW